MNKEADEEYLQIKEEGSNDQTTVDVESEDLKESKALERGSLYSDDLDKEYDLKSS